MTIGMWETNALPISRVLISGQGGLPGPRRPFLHCLSHSDTWLPCCTRTAATARPRSCSFLVNGACYVLCFCFCFCACSSSQQSFLRLGRSQKTELPIRWSTNASVLSPRAALAGCSHLPCSRWPHFLFFFCFVPFTVPEPEYLPCSPASQACQDSLCAVLLSKRPHAWRTQPREPGAKLPPTHQFGILQITVNSVSLGGT